MKRSNIITVFFTIFFTAIFCWADTEPAKIGAQIHLENSIIEQITIRTEIKVDKSATREIEIIREPYEGQLPYKEDIKIPVGFRWKDFRVDEWGHYHYTAVCNFGNINDLSWEPSSILFTQKKTFFKTISEFREHIWLDPQKFMPDLGQNNQQSETKPLEQTNFTGIVDKLWTELKKTWKNITNGGISIRTFNDTATAVKPQENTRKPVYNPIFRSTVIMPGKLIETNGVSGTEGKKITISWVLTLTDALKGFQMHATSETVRWGNIITLICIICAAASLCLFLWLKGRRQKKGGEDENELFKSDLEI